MQSALKLLAQKAKKRLSTAGQNYSESEEKTKSAYLSSSSYALVVSNQQIEDDPLFEKVKKIVLSGENVSNPLALLTDYKVFNNLSQSEKERYMIEISKKYNEIKSYIESKNLDATT